MSFLVIFSIISETAVFLYFLAIYSLIKEEYENISVSETSKRNVIILPEDESDRVAVEVRK